MWMLLEICQFENTPYSTNALIQFLNSRNEIQFCLGKKLLLHFFMICIIRCLTILLSFFA